MRPRSPTRLRTRTVAWPAVALLALAVAAFGCVRRSQGRRAAPTTGYCSKAYQASVGWPDPERAARVCQCESSGNPRAVSPNGRYAGLFQFSRESWQAAGGGDPFDPWLNSSRALGLWRKKGWKPWPSCSR